MRQALPCPPRARSLPFAAMPDRTEFQRPLRVAPGMCVLLRPDAARRRSRSPRPSSPTSPGSTSPCRSWAGWKRRARCAPVPRAAGCCCSRRAGSVRPPTSSDRPMRASMPPGQAGGSCRDREGDRRQPAAIVDITSRRQRDPAPAPWPATRPVDPCAAAWRAAHRTSRRSTSTAPASGAAPTAPRSSPADARRNG